MEGNKNFNNYAIILVNVVHVKFFLVLLLEVTAVRQPLVSFTTGVKGDPLKNEGTGMPRKNTCRPYVITGNRTRNTKACLACRDSVD